MKKTLIYIDPGYDAEFGHYVRTAGLIKKEAEKQEVTLKHYVSLKVSEDVASERDIERRFISKPGLEYEDRPEELLRDFYHQLDGILDALQEGSDVEHKIFMYTGHPLHLPLIALAINNHVGRLKNLTAHVCIFYLDLDFCRGEASEEYEDMLYTVSGLVELADPGNLLTVLVDSERSRKLYEPYFERPVRLLHFPIEEVPDPAEVKKTGKRDRVKLCYIGQTTRRSGYDFMYDAYKKIADTDLIEKVEFFIKHTPRAQLYGLFNDFLKERKNVTHVSDFVSNEQIMKFVHECDVLLVPYSKKHYPTQTSAMIVEALFRHKIVIAPKETWMSDQLEKYGAGEMFLSDNLESFVHAIEKIVTNIDFYRERASRNMDQFYEMHSVERLFADLGLSDEKPREPQSVSETAYMKMNKDFENYFVNQACRAWRLWDYHKVIEKQEARINEMEPIVAKQRINVKKLEEELEAVQESVSWKITAPLRWLGTKSRSR